VSVDHHSTGTSFYRYEKKELNASNPTSLDAQPRKGIMAKDSIKESTLKKKEPCFRAIEPQVSILMERLGEENGKAPVAMLPRVLVKK
jgi:hypothetical protein